MKKGIIFSQNEFYIIDAEMRGKENNLNGGSLFPVDEENTFD